MTEKFTQYTDENGENFARGNNKILVRTSNDNGGKLVWVYMFRDGKSRRAFAGTFPGAAFNKKLLTLMLAENFRQLGMDPDYFSEVISAAVEYISNLD